MICVKYEGILRFVRIEVVNILQAVFNAIANHVLPKHVIDKAWFIDSVASL